MQQQQIDAVEESEVKRRQLKRDFLRAIGQIDCHLPAKAPRIEQKLSQAHGKSETTTSHTLGYEDLLRSYEIHNWTGSPISPRELARKGWKHFKDKSVQCKCCRKFLSVQMPSIQDIELTTYHKCLRFTDDMMSRRLPKELQKVPLGLVACSLAGWHLSLLPSPSSPSILSAACSLCARTANIKLSKENPGKLDVTRSHYRWCPFLDVDESGQTKQTNWQLRFDTIMPKRDDSLDVFQEVVGMRRRFDRLIVPPLPEEQTGQLECSTPIRPTRNPAQGNIPPIPVAHAPPR
ncbi:hypothetical protein WR25_14140 [Diploscapter pachys]|uniref:C3HC-type domain-containing protein n=1 Tax=Diploscapter pachys TaxID=2018661 RepID=A0A2A2KPI1_9BILA|nr:hypothetical protein WR25_14140 [Diploscapter pachys]